MSDDNWLVKSRLIDTERKLKKMVDEVKWKHDNDSYNKCKDLKKMLWDVRGAIYDLD